MDIQINDKEIIIKLGINKKVISNSPINGGIKEDIEYMVNYDVKNKNGIIMVENTYENYMKNIIKEMKLDPEKTVALSTSVSMDKVSIKSKKFKELEVKSITTAGIGFNGARAGDKAVNYEENGEFIQIGGGTINTILLINVNLTNSALVRAVMTATEAKSAAIQELIYGSNYSSGIATGSGTDGILIAVDKSSKTLLTDAGKHTKLGELIANTVKDSVKEGLKLNMGLDARYQFSIFRRLKRFGVNRDEIYECFIKENNIISKDEFLVKFNKVDRDKQLVVYTSMVVHLIDQYIWDLIDEEGLILGYSLIVNDLRSGYPFYMDNNKLKGKELIDSIIESYIREIVLLID